MGLESTTLAPAPIVLESPAPLPAAARQGRRRVTTAEATVSVSLLILLGIVGIVDGGIVGSLLTPIKNDLGLADEQFSRMTALGAFVGLWANPIYGFLGNRFGRKRVVFGGLLLLSLSSITSGLSTGYPMLLASRVAMAFAAVSYTVIAPSWIADLYAPKWRNFVFTLYHLKNRAGGSGALFLGSLIAVRYDWHVAFLVTGVATLVLSFFILGIYEPKPGEADGQVEAAPKRHSLRFGLNVFRHRGFLLHILAFSLFGIGIHGQQWIPAYLYRTFHITNKEASGFLGSVLLASLPVGFLGGWLTGVLSLHRRHGGYAAFLSVTSTAAAGAFFIAYHAADLAGAEWWIAVAYAIFALSVGSLTTLIVETVSPALRTSAASYGLLVHGFIGSVLITELWGVLSDRYGLANAILLAPTGFLLGGVLWAVLAVWQRRQGEPAWRVKP